MRIESSETLQHAHHRVLHEVSNSRGTAGTRHSPHERVHHRVITLDECVQRGSLALLGTAQGQIVQLAALNGVQHVAHGVQHVLAVVHDHEEPTPRQGVRDRPRQGHAGRMGDAQRRGHDVGHRGGVAEGGQLHQPHAVVEIADQLGSAVLKGDGCEAAVLEEAGTARAAMLIAVTGDDEDNLVACQVAKGRFGVPMTIARLSDPRNERLFKARPASLEDLAIPRDDLQKAIATLKEARTAFAPP